MKSTILIAVSLAALSLAGCKKDAASTNEAAGTATPSDEAAMASASPAASAGQMFADTAAASDMFEIETSKLAINKSQSAKVKRFAEQMIKAHSQSTTKLKTAAGAASPPITPAGQMTAMQQQALTDLSGKTGADFDTAYAKAQVDGHQMTLDALKAYSANGDVPSLKALATELIPIVTGHLNMARSL
jgi:putative membrane protein